MIETDNEQHKIVSQHLAEREYIRL